MILTILSLCVLNLKLASFKEVYWETPLGSLIGYTRISLSGHEFYAFEGVPYAKPPLGNLRFKAPIAADLWQWTLNATRLSKHCMQGIRGSELPGQESEDCLYLNIYTRNLTPEPKADILFVIFGGRYQDGTVMATGPDFLMDNDNLIFISVNYRLNIFGFLSFNDPSLKIPGNAGAKDIVLALQWVQRHIQGFGGDPNKVTVVGCSSGGHLVNLLMFHPVASKMFRHAISQSGSALVDLYKLPHPYHVLANYINYTGNIRDENSFYKHLLSLSSHQLVRAYQKFSHFYDTPGFRYEFSVTIESTLNNPDPFLIENPGQLILNGQFPRIPYLTSFARFEGGLFNLLGHAYSKNYTNFGEYIPFYLKNQFTKTEYALINDEIRRFFYGHETPDDSNYEILLNIYGDGMFLFPIILAIKTMAHVTNYTMPIYAYEFNMRTNDLNTISSMLHIRPPYCAHCDEVGYAYSQRSNLEYVRVTHKNDCKTRRQHKTYTNMLMNFVRTGNPKSLDPNDELSHVDWAPIRSKHLNYLIVQPNLTLATNPHAERMQFWHKLYRKYLGPKNTPHTIFVNDMNLFL